MSHQSGNALFLILIAVALFAALGFAFTQGSRSNLGWVTSEKNKADAVQSAQCSHAVSTATRRLQLKGCATISSETNVALITEPRCAIYHIQGGGLSPCLAAPAAPVICTVPTPGNACPDGSIYVGLSPDGNKRMYTTATEMVTAKTWATSFEDVPSPLDMCSGSGAGCVQGKIMSAYLAALATPGAPYNAAIACETLSAHGKDDWYLPSNDELDMMYYNKAQINFTAIGIAATYYWSSSQASGWNGRSYHMGAWPDSSSDGKLNSRNVRCIRSD